MLSLVLATAMASFSLAPPLVSAPTSAPPVLDGGLPQSTGALDVETAIVLTPPPALDSADARSGDLDNPVQDAPQPCRQYADQPSSQGDGGFVRCWNLKKASWLVDNPSAAGMSLPDMNSPLGQGGPAGARPRETPTP